MADVWNGRGRVARDGARSSRAPLSFGATPIGSPSALSHSCAGTTEEMRREQRGNEAGTMQCACHDRWGVDPVTRSRAVLPVPPRAWVSAPPSGRRRETKHVGPPQPIFSGRRQALAGPLGHGARFPGHRVAGRRVVGPSPERRPHCPILGYVHSFGATTVSTTVRGSRSGFPEAVLFVGDLDEANYLHEQCYSVPFRESRQPQPGHTACDPHGSEGPWGGAPPRTASS